MKKPNILKIIKKFIFSMINDNCGYTVFRVGNGGIQIDRDSEDGYTEIADITFGNKNDSSVDEDEPLPSDDTSYKCTGAAVVNMANIFGGVCAVAFVAKEGTDCAKLGYFEIKLRELEDKFENIYKYVGASMNNPSAKHLSHNNSHSFTILWNLSMDPPEEDYAFPNDAFLIMCYVDVSDYNYHFPYKGPEDTRTDTMTMFADCIKFKDVPQKAIDSAINGIMAAINTGYDNTLTCGSDTGKIGGKYFIPVVCMVGDDGEYAEEFCHGLLEKEKLTIGESIRSICGLEYTPEVPDCNWTDIPYIEKCIKRKFKKLFETSRAEEVLKIRLIRTLLSDNTKEVE